MDEVRLSPNNGFGGNVRMRRVRPFDGTQRSNRHALMSTRTPHLDVDLPQAGVYAFARRQPDSDPCACFPVEHALWDGWENDALVGGEASARFLNTAKVHAIERRGRHCSIDRPVTVPHSPRGRPVTVQAGAADGFNLMPDVLPTARRCSWTPWFRCYATRLMPRGLRGSHAARALRVGAGSSAAGERLYNRRTRTDPAKASASVSNKGRR